MNISIGLQNIDLNLLRTLVVLVEERSTIGAARRLLLSQPTVSGTLGRLREIFSDELLVRNGRALEPTARAMELLEAIRPSLDSLDAALAASTPFDPKNHRRDFRFGCTDAVALAVLPRLSRSLREEAPDCNLIVRLGDFRVLPSMLASGEVSSALAYFRDDPPASAKIVALRHSPWVVLRDAGTPRLEGLDDFCERPHALMTPMGNLNGFVDEGLAQLGRTRRVVIGVTSFALLLSVLPDSNIVATVPDFVAHRLVQICGLAIEPCPVAVPPVINNLVWRAVSDRDPAERWFRDKIRIAFLPD